MTPLKSLIPHAVFSWLAVRFLLYIPPWQTTTASTYRLPAWRHAAATDGGTIAERRRVSAKKTGAGVTGVAASP
ncbi:MAG TPA: hypothetical protein VFE68_18520, partial [Vicinamibacteria bacterium]|nr:hypothetical protein [Vicinamibacteria bacterium]